MPATTISGDDVITALEPGSVIPEPAVAKRAEPLLVLPAAAPAGKPFRLYPEWAQRGPFW